MGENIKQRFILFIKYLQISQRKFEENCGINTSTINNIRDGISSPNLAKVIKTYPELNLDWLVSGEGEMLKKNGIEHYTSENYSPITSNIQIDTCRTELEKAEIKISYLERIIKDKEQIIDLLTNKK